MRSWCAACAGALLVLTACSGGPPAPEGAPGTPGSPTPSASASAKPVDPLLLLGAWNVLTPTGKPTREYLRIGDDLELSPPCGVLNGSWSANAAGMFLAETDGGSSGCFSTANGGGKAPSWLTSATTFRVDGPTRVLRDGAGDVVARLSPGRGMYRAPNRTQLRMRLATSPPLPGTLTPATATSLTGRWLPSPVRHYTAGTPAVTFAADGSWTGSDGCNAQSGRWRLGLAGTFLTTGGPSTLVGCAGVAVGSWMSRVRQVGFAGATMVLRDGSGAEIGRLVRA
ncbi:MAG TPA: META domain-containing protein [Frankiaceae bacterium]|jgi:hypothetical protein|nr:META domain-containing protein [Frankiaceae bacterium]